MAIAITGATGYLGSRILHHLLSATDTEPLVLLGRDTPAVLRERIGTAMQWLDGPRALPVGALGRIRCLQADLEQPQLGLDSAELTVITDSLSEVWHCAASTAQHGDPMAIHRVNVLGTRGVLRLADRAPAARLIYLSTAFVAGRRTAGHVLEDDLSERAGFHTPYEESKFTAERLVRHWALAHGRTVTVVRPSVVVEDRFVPDGLAQHPLGTLARHVRQALHARTPAGDLALSGCRGAGVLRFRFPGPPDGSLNLVQADHAVRAMLCAAAAHRSPGVLTVHVTHPVNTPLATIARAFESSHPGLIVELTPAVPDPSSLERYVRQNHGDLLGYAGHRRTYDRTRLLSCPGVPPGPPPVDAGYLARGLAPGWS
ncbi:SDR family oxidoreductase [Streptomyces orinoci]|uniref:SDR family oxidoreductase n=1 Tax=Streptomyces orinoci TaxID=67339 RepID=A0ABV3K0Y0_STRON|nr:SDR family oxidoreductase [Streptomyces orinoci]